MSGRNKGNLNSSPDFLFLSQLCVGYRLACLEGNVSLLVLPFDLWVYQLCLNFLLFCRLCHEGRDPEEIEGRPSSMLHPMGTLLLMMRLLLLGSGQLEFCRAIFDSWANDHRPIGDIPMETRSRRQCSVEIASVSSKSCIIYSSQVAQALRKLSSSIL